MIIKTSYDSPPILTKLLVCWTAWNGDNWEPGDPVGYGTTEDEAIQDLMEQMDDQ